MSDERPQFDHLLHWVPDVDAAAQAYVATGLPAESRPADLGFQTGGWQLDERFIEILTVTDEEAFRKHVFADCWTLLRDRAAAVAALGGGAMCFAVDVADSAATAERLRGEGRPVAEFTIDFEDLDVHFHQVFVLDAPSWAPFFITYRPPRAQLPEKAPDQTVERGTFDLTAIVIETPDPAASAAWLGQLLRITFGDNVVRLAGGEVRFVPGPADRITEAVLSGPKSLDHTIAGLRYRTV